MPDVPTPDQPPAIPACPITTGELCEVCQRPGHSAESAAQVREDDQREILFALGLGGHRRRTSPHHVVHAEILPRIGALMRHLGQSLEKAAIAAPAASGTPDRDHDHAGHYALWAWFGLSRASWVTLPRVLAHAMPDDWQARMAELLEEWDATWDQAKAGIEGTRVLCEGENRRLVPSGPNLTNYRHPDQSWIEAMRLPADPDSTTPPPA